MLELGHRVNSLETALERFITHVEQNRQKTDDIIAQMRQQAEQDRQRTDEMMAQMHQRTDKMIAEMRQQAEHNQQQTDKMIAEMRQKAEHNQQRTDKMIAEMRQQAEHDQQRTDKMIAEMRQQAEHDRRELNQKWGELANRLGTLAEDIVAPNLPRIAHEQFGCPPQPDDFMVRRWVKHKIDSSKRREFDVVVVYPDKVFINETKSTLRMSYIDEFIAVIADIDGYFPEYQDKQLIAVFAALYLPENMITYLTKHQIYALGMGKETMELLNFEAIGQRV